MPEDKQSRLRGLAQAKGISLNRLIDEMATLALAEFGCETRFRTRAAKGSTEKGLALLDKLDRAFPAKV